MTIPRLLSYGATICVATSAIAATVEVNEFKDPVLNPVPDSWYKSDVRPGGTATITDLAGIGGNLESAQPLPTGAARLTTTTDNTAKAEVFTYADFGLASSVLADIDLSFSYYKQTSSSAAPAPALKLSIYNPTGTGSGDNDSYGQLIFEPYWNNPGLTVTPDQWNSVSINETTGSGSDASGGWWWSGGFGIGSGSGGPPVRSLSEWLTAFQTGPDSLDFSGARVTGLGVGIGTYNPDQNTYFDAVSIKVGSVDKTYDFEIASVPDAGSSAALMGLSAAALFALRRRQK